MGLLGPIQTPVRLKHTQIFFDLIFKFGLNFYQLQHSYNLLFIESKHKMKTRKKNVRKEVLLLHCQFSFPLRVYRLSLY